MKRLIASIWLLLAFGVPAQAHDLRPAYLSITETASETYSVVWKTPAMSGFRLALYPRLPGDIVDMTAREGAFLNDAYVERWNVRVSAGLASGTISIDGLSTIRTDVLVRIERLNGETLSARLTPADPSFEIPAASRLMQVANTYLWLGAEHILFGFDHLLFVLALIILVGNWKRIALTVTAFTVAHSITLGAATLGVVNIPRLPIEAAIALSIALVAVEIVNSTRGQDGVAMRFPWVVAFAFGLLHGLGFAGALSEVGLPAHAIPVALLFFNIGVELGQLLFIAGVMASFLIPRFILRELSQIKASRPHQWLQVGGAYCIGGVASFWVIERVCGFWA